VQGGPARTATHAASLTLTATAALPSLSCLQSLALSDAVMTYTWSDVSAQPATVGGAPLAMVGTSNDPHALVIPAGSLTAGLIYTFKVVAAMPASVDIAPPNGFTNLATVVVVVVPQPLVAQIAGGIFRQVSFNCVPRQVSAQSK
jgi:hypothetical protein